MKFTFFKRLNVNEIAFDITFFVFTSVILSFDILHGPGLLNHVSYPVALLLIFAINGSITFNMGQVLEKYGSYSRKLFIHLVFVVFGITALMVDLYTPYILRMYGIITSDLNLLWAHLVAMTAFLAGAVMGELNYDLTQVTVSPQSHHRYGFIPTRPALFISMIPIAYALLTAAAAIWLIELDSRISFVISLIFIALATFGLNRLYRFLSRRIIPGRLADLYPNSPIMRRVLMLISKGAVYILLAVLISILSDIYIYSYVSWMNYNYLMPDIYRLFFILLATGLIPYRLIIAFEPPVNPVNLVIGVIVYFLFIRSAILAVA